MFSAYSATALLAQQAAGYQVSQPGQAPAPPHPHRGPSPQVSDEQDNQLSHSERIPCGGKMQHAIVMKSLESFPLPLRSESLFQHPLKTQTLKDARLLDPRQ